MHKHTHTKKSVNIILSVLLAFFPFSSSSIHTQFNITLNPWQYVSCFESELTKVSPDQGKTPAVQSKKEEELVFKLLVLI